MQQLVVQGVFQPFFDVDAVVEQSGGYFNRIVVPLPAALSQPQLGAAVDGEADVFGIGDAQAVKLRHALFDVFAEVMHGIFCSLFSYSMMCEKMSGKFQILLDISALQWYNYFVTAT